MRKNMRWFGGDIGSGLGPIVPSVLRATKKFILVVGMLVCLVSTATARVGKTGPTGPTGPTGATGLTGPKGVQGIQGVLGPKGFDGSTGPTGPKGAAGADGSNGTNGVDGATGPIGPSGTPGTDIQTHIASVAKNVCDCYCVAPDGCVPNEDTAVTTAKCNAKEIVLGGGFSNKDANILSSAPSNTGGGWDVAEVFESDSSCDVQLCHVTTAYAICIVGGTAIDPTTGP